MKSSSRNLILIVLITLLISSISVVADKKIAKTKTESYQFETKALALNDLGMATSRDPKLALRASGGIYLLSVYTWPTSTTKAETKPTTANETNETSEHHAGSGFAQLGLSVSHDGGDTFSAPVPISEKTAKVSSHGENSPSLAFGATEMYALWEQQAERGTDLMFSRSTNFGRSFDKPIKVTDKTKPSTNAFSFMATAPNNHIYAIWLDGRNPNPEFPGTSSVFLTKSSDRGATFSKNLEVAKNVCPCCRPSIGFGSKGEVFVSWRTATKDNIRDIVVATSTDQGATFSEPIRVAEDNWKIEGCPHSGATMTNKGDRLYIAWYSEGGPRAGIRISWSNDGGKTFAAPTIASGNILDANHPAFASSEEGKLMLIFQGRNPQQKDRWGALQPYLVEVTDNKVSKPMSVPGSKKSIFYPAMAVGSLGRVFMAWTEPTEQGTSIMFLRARGKE